MFAYNLSVRNFVNEILFYNIYNNILFRLRDLKIDTICIFCITLGIWEYSGDIKEIEQTSEVLSYRLLF